MEVMLLCGGQGKRLRPVGEARPKPMVEVGGQPILWHIMKCFAHHGHQRFVLCLGHQGHVIRDYFLSYHTRRGDLTVHTRSGTLEERALAQDDWTVTLAETGLHTLTAGRIKRALPHVAGERFILTYADAVADVDIAALLTHHRRMGRLATLTSVHPPGRFGELRLQSDVVTSFAEKPRASKEYINGGFMVLEREFVDRYIPDDPECALERGPLQAAAQQGHLAAYRHEGWWQCMDTPDEHAMLEQLWRSGTAPWKVWP